MLSMLHTGEQRRERLTSLVTEEWHVSRIFLFFLSIVDLQYCVSFRCTAKWFSSAYPFFFQILFHYRVLQDIEYSSLFCTVNPCCLSEQNLERWIGSSPEGQEWKLIPGRRKRPCKNPEVGILRCLQALVKVILTE